MNKLQFTSSDAFLESDPAACESAELAISSYIEATYGALRHDGGRELAAFIDGAWQLTDGRRFSDWAVDLS